MCTIVYLFWLLLICHASATGPICHRCDDVLMPSHCTNVVTCLDTEQCVVQKLRAPSLREYFKLGCIPRNACLQNQTTNVQPIGRRDENGSGDSAKLSALDMTSQVPGSRANPGDNVLCLECANDANDQLGKCGSSPPNSRRCLHCNSVANPRDCDSVVECAFDENCFIGLQPTSPVDQTLTYTMGCQRNAVCRGLSLVHHTIGCIECCSTSYCNHVCNDSALKTTTHVPLVTITMATVNHKPVVTIVGPASADYNTSVSLTCQTDVHVDQYYWTLDAHLLITARSSTLTIPAVNANSTGTYRCTAIRNGQSGYESGYAEHKVDINPKPGHVISFTKQVDHQSGVVTFTCVYDGYPLPTIDWSFSGVSGTHLVTDIHINDARSFGIISTYNSVFHDGNYTCGAKNYLGGDSKTVMLP
ncbi:uncharacterized protein LOC127847940 isoform X3 [Dreissena polymorpha]|uniref:uncharacterized protein LOC127847940 isoform X3 n=1 Tax=Dreissena polymorpha TaxID=45954 RepID=UPI0022653593|nr:uncharacterized protein LOC127847940 isoform X3 [Dreissena polymorpha]